MTYEEFLEESLSRGLLRRQKSDLRGVEKLILRAHKDDEAFRGRTKGSH